VLFLRVALRLAAFAERLRTDFLVLLRDFVVFFLVLARAFAFLTVRLTVFRAAGMNGRPLAAAFPARAPTTPPTTAPMGPATLPMAAPVTAPAVSFGIGGIRISSDD